MVKIGFNKGAYDIIVVIRLKFVFNKEAYAIRVGRRSFLIKGRMVSEEGV
jgi:hypothetical protein